MDGLDAKKVSIALVSSLLLALCYVLYRSPKNSHDKSGEQVLSSLLLALCSLLYRTQKNSHDKIGLQ
jgi:hypothetical protein